MESVLDGKLFIVKINRTAAQKESNKDTKMLINNDANTFAVRRKP